MAGYGVIIMFCCFACCLFSFWCFYPHSSDIHRYLFPMYLALQAALSQSLLATRSEYLGEGRREGGRGGGRRRGAAAGWLVGWVGRDKRVYQVVFVFVVSSGHYGWVPLSLVEGHRPSPVSAMQLEGGVHHAPRGGCVGLGHWVIMFKYTRIDVGRFGSCFVELALLSFCLFYSVAVMYWL